MPKPQNGTPPPRPVFAVRIEDQARSSCRLGSPRRQNRSLIFPQSLLLSRFPSLGFRSNKARQYLKPSLRRQNKTSRLRTSSSRRRRVPPPRQDLRLKAHVAVEVDAVAATAAKEASLAKPLPPRRNKMTLDFPPPAHPFLRRLKIPWSREQADLPNPSCPRLPVEPMGDAGGIALRGRYGDPGLSSRLFSFGNAIPPIAHVRPGKT
jgi:hypothetical protein